MTRLSRDEHAEELALHDVYVDGELIPSHAVIEANEEAYYAELSRLDSHGDIVYRSLDGTHPGQTRQVAQTYMRYGEVRIVRRQSQAA